MIKKKIDKRKSTQLNVRIDILSIIVFLGDLK